MNTNNNNINLELGLNINDAALVAQKSVHTIRKLIQERKIKTSKVRSNNRSEVRIKASELSSHYGQDNIDNELLINLNKIIDKNNTNYPKNTNIFDNDGLNSNTRYLDKIISDLQNDKKVLQAELESRRSEAERMQKLLENQQALALNLQNQMNQLTENQNLMLTSKKSSWVSKKSDQILDITEKAPKKHFWQIWR